MKLGMKPKQSTAFFLLLQVVGIAFFAIFSAAYWIPLQTKELLHSTPIFHWALSIVGGVFLLLCLVAVVLSVIKPKPEA